MATSPEAIAKLIAEATAPGFRDDLLAKGQARSMVWRDGVLPAEAPQFSTLLTYDLLSYAYALMNQGLRLLDQGAELAAARSAFEHAASAIEAAIARGRANAERDFHRLLAASCYHLARYAARAFSLLHEGLIDANLSLSEQAIALLMLRDLDALEALIVEERMAGASSEQAMIARLDASGALAAADGDIDDAEDALLDVVDQALTDNFLGALATALLAFERGASDLIEAATLRLNIGLASAAELNLVPIWWCHRLAIHLLGDLWSSSFHVRLPKTPTDGSDDWAAYRELFIATLLRRGRAEIDLWPSQIDAATRALNLADNMVVSLPTSAGKTRVAELCILACLAAGRRVVFVTPLRALSAQTEVTLQRTFQPLGKTVSSLYGAIGVLADVGAGPQPVGNYVDLSRPDARGRADRHRRVPQCRRACGTRLRRRRRTGLDADVRPRFEAAYRLEGDGRERQGQGDGKRPAAAAHVPRPAYGPKDQGQIRGSDGRVSGWRHRVGFPGAYYRGARPRRERARPLGGLSAQLSCFPSLRAA